MSVLVTTLLVGCGVMIGRLIAGSRGRDKDAPQPDVTTNAKIVAKEEPHVSARLAGFPCQLGDVVLRSAGDEAWLAGAIILSEGGDAVVVVFFSPEAGADRAVLAKPASSELMWLTHETGEAIGLPTALREPPTALEIGDDRFERRRRLPLRAERVGSGAPEIGEDVIFAEYTGLGDGCLVVLSSKDRVLAYRGEVLVSGMYDVLPKPASE